MRNIRMCSQYVFFYWIMLFLMACGVLAVSQDSRSGPGQRKAPPLQGTTQNGGMLQTAQPRSALRPSLSGNDVEQMTPVQFRALPDSAMLHYKGQSLTKFAFIGQKLKEFQLQAKRTTPKGALSFETLKVQFQRKQAAALAEENTRVEAVIESLNSRTKQVESSPAFLVLAKEFDEMQRRYPGSSPTQQLQLKRRALEIHNQLLKMEQEIAPRDN